MEFTFHSSSTYLLVLFNLDIQFEFIKFGFYTVIDFYFDVVSKDLALYHFPKGFDSCIRFSMRSHRYNNTVRYLQPGFLTKILNTINKFTSHTFTFKFFSQLHFQRYSKVSFIANQPAGNILADDFHISRINSYGLRSEEHTSELQSRQYLVCRLLLEKKNIHELRPHLRPRPGP